MIDECIEDADELGARDVHRDYMEKCLAIEERCPNSEPPGGAEECRISQVVKYTDEYMRSDVIPCTQAACNQITECFERIDEF
jgi:hypothetical protein